mmetsp:Transcript_9193/g.11585  ORF Transcript_9193/g.11585 Transcript_9193/m.11585 type:complete len:358 (-) Transcript_9193:182-1255(-)
MAAVKTTHFKGKVRSGRSRRKLFTCVKYVLAIVLGITMLRMSLRDNDDDDAIEALDMVPRGTKDRQLSPFFSLEPLTKSLHPKYKLWTEMNTKDQNAAMEFVGQYLKKYGEMILPPGKGLHEYNSKKQGTCEFDKTIGRTGHTLCGPPPEKPCTFLSFGINDDPSFDRDLADSWGCRGFASDPTVHHPSKLHDNVTFHNIAATTLQQNEERLNNKGGEGDWWTTSFPKLRYFLGLEKIDILKIDCEGCEVALARDMLREDPKFLFHVDQISIETHVTKTWMTTREHVYYLGLVFVLLEEAGFKMEWSSVFGCSKRHEITGCMEEFEKYHWPCGYKPWPAHPKAVKGRSCQEFTLKRY